MKCRSSRESGGSCIERVPIFAGLSCEERMEIAEIVSSRSLKKGDMIYRAGDEGGTWPRTSASRRRPSAGGSPRSRTRDRSPLRDTGG
ncbi:MAG: hypothetical protein GX181_01295 [Synergistaceae bacterium]|nr:hypothetical protein [Synergistota bacterium]NLM70581.1 hypothetical protein [Synergistaceae bacterium]